MSHVCVCVCLPSNHCVLLLSSSAQSRHVALLPETIPAVAGLTVLHSVQTAISETRVNVLL